MVKLDTSEASVATFCGTLCVIEYEEPDWWYLEDTLDAQSADDNVDSNLAIVLHKLRNTKFVHYSVTYFNLSSTDYMLPQRRRRIYIVGTKIHQGTYSADLEVLMASNRAITKLLSHPALPLAAFLEDDDSDALAQEYERRQDVFLKQTEQETAGAKWITMHMEFCEKAARSWPLRMPEPLVDNRWISMLPRREQECVIWGYLNGCTTADHSQMLARMPQTSSDTTPTLLPDGSVWVYKAADVLEPDKEVMVQRPLLGREKLSLQGIPHVAWPHAEMLSEAEMSNLAGNAFSSTTALVALTLAVFGAAFATAGTASDQESVDNVALAMMALKYQPADSDSD